MSTVFRSLSSVFLLIGVVLFVQACTTLSKEECVVTDWRSLGERDGASGKPLNYFSQHVDACKKTTAKPDQASWQSGHKQGARRYCTPENGLIAGNAGRTYHNICEPDQQPAFIAAYELGRERKAILDRRKAKVRQLGDHDRQIRAVKDQVKKAKIDEREATRELFRLRRSRRAVLRDIEDYDFEIDRFDRRLSRNGYQPPAKPAPVF